MKTRILCFLVGFGLIAAAPLSAKEAPVPVRTVNPEYPAEMRRSGASGLVTVSCIIDEKGSVTDPKVEKSTHATFEQPAVDALRKWKFKPGTEDGNAVPMRILVPIKFICED
jgi:protein TonB